MFRSQDRSPPTADRICLTSHDLCVSRGAMSLYGMPRFLRSHAFFASSIVRASFAFSAASPAHCNFFPIYPMIHAARVTHYPSLG